MRNFLYRLPKCANYCLFVYFLFGICSPSIAGHFSRVEILREELPKIPLKQIIKNPRLTFLPYHRFKYNKEEKTYWLRFIYSKVEVQKVYYLFSPFIINKKLDLYYYVGDSLLHFQSGVVHPFQERNFYLPDAYLELPISTKPTTCWLHVESFYGHSFQFEEFESKQVIRHELQIFTVEFFFIGVGFLAAIFSFLYYLFLRDRLYLFYGIFSSFLLLGRLTHNGFIFHYLNPILEFDTLKSIFNLYSISYVGVNISLLFYFHEFLKFYRRPKSYYFIIYSFATIRFILLLIQLCSQNPTLSKIVEHHIYDLIIQCFLLFTVLTTSKRYLRPNMIAGVSIVILIVGNLRFILPLWGISGSSGRPFDFFLNYAGVEVILFAIGMAYRSYFLKKEHDIAVAHMVETLKESQLEKDFINKELEIKVEQRTKQIQEMNALLNTHNIQLKSEISHAIEARVFRSVMNFKEFQQIFIDDHACYSYLAKVKWKDPKDARCSRCDYGTNTILSNFSRRCGKCGYVESVTNGTLFHRLKFPILKAFYITYRTSNSIKELPTIIDMAEEINLRPGTLGNFRQKVIQLLQSYSSKKKHKDGWTHLIEYSIAQAKA